MFLTHALATSWELAPRSVCLVALWLWGTSVYHRKLIVMYIVIYKAIIFAFFYAERGWQCTSCLGRAWHRVMYSVCVAVRRLGYFDVVFLAASSASLSLSFGLFPCACCVLHVLDLSRH